MEVNKPTGLEDNNERPFSRKGNEVFTDQRGGSRRGRRKIASELPTIDPSTMKQAGLTMPRNARVANYESGKKSMNSVQYQKQIGQIFSERTPDLDLDQSITAKSQVG